VDGSLVKNDGTVNNDEMDDMDSPLDLMILWIHNRDTPFEHSEDTAIRGSVIVSCDIVQFESLFGAKQVANSMDFCQNGHNRVER